MNNKNLVYQFKISLKGISAPIWRRIQVPQSYSFWDFHVALQDALGWFDCHLHIFRIMNPETEEIEEIGIPDDQPFEDDRPCLPGWDVPLSIYFRKSGTRADYEYDFGDGWEHAVVLEEIYKPNPQTRVPDLPCRRTCLPSRRLWRGLGLRRIIKNH